MALPTAYAKFVLGGPISDEDQWSIGFWVNSAALALPTQTQMDTGALAILNAFQSQFWGASTNPWKAMVSVDGKLTTINAYWYTNPGGLAVQSQQTITAVVGTGTAANPPYTALVASLHSTAAGRSGRGRVYLPCTGKGTLAGSSQAQPVQGHADNLASFLTHLGDGSIDTHVLGTASVYSRTKGQMNTINAVSINSIFDTQRGRNQGTALHTYSHSV